MILTTPYHASVNLDTNPWKYCIACRNYINTAAGHSCANRACPLATAKPIAA